MNFSGDTLNGWIADVDARRPLKLKFRCLLGINGVVKLVDEAPV